jgi:hypothetical protein
MAVAHLQCEGLAADRRAARVTEGALMSDEAQAAFLEGLDGQVRMDGWVGRVWGLGVVCGRVGTAFGGGGVTFWCCLSSADTNKRNTCIRHILMPKLQHNQNTTQNNTNL